MKSIYIYGASGHGLVVADIAHTCGYTDIRFLDDGDNCYPTFNDIKNRNNIPIAFGIGNNYIRAKLFTKVSKDGFEVVSLIHPSSIIASNVKVGKAVVIMANTVINANSEIAEGVIINTGSIIEHECVVDSFSHISPNVALAGNVKINKFSHIGIGSCIIQGLTIGKNCIIGAGSVVIKDISDNKKAYGNPCREVGDTINE